MTQLQAGDTRVECDLCWHGMGGSHPHTAYLRTRGSQTDEVVRAEYAALKHAHGLLVTERDSLRVALEMIAKHAVGSRACTAACVDMRNIARAALGWPAISGETS